MEYSVGGKLTFKNARYRVALNADLVLERPIEEAGPAHIHLTPAGYIRKTTHLCIYPPSDDYTKIVCRLLGCACEQMFTVYELQSGQGPVCFDLSEQASVKPSRDGQVLLMELITYKDNNVLRRREFKFPIAGAG
jgi:hypothetical protein